MTDKKYTKENIWVIIPAYNESKRIENVLTQLQKITPNIIVVDDGSTDRTSEIATKLGITTIQPKKNIGKGGALIKGIDHAIYAKNAQGIVMLDADGQHDPTLTELFIDSLNGADIVFGSRQLNSNMPTIRRIGNHLITKTLQTLYGIKITDALSGYKAMTTETYFKISWPENNHYNVEADIFINTALTETKFVELEIPTIYAEKKSISKTTGLKILLHTIKRRFL